ncbi:MAG: hypothetical protein PARBA_03724 [Parabacteroides sp.]
MKVFNKYTVLLAGGLMLLSSCNDYLNKEPIDAITPETYLYSEADLGSYALEQYNFNTHSGAGLGIWANDNHTDNQATSSYDNRWVPGEWRVKDHYDNASDDPYYFANIYNCNYFLETVVPRYEKGEISGADDMVKHYIGEVYFLRAWNYFSKLKTFGDFPIVKETLPDEKSVLVEASKRQPRHLVARFILEDLDKAIELLSNNPTGGTNRITKNAAYLVKSRVALYEASWETYHANTAFVPNGPGYPGPQADYDAQSEIAFFLKACKEAAAVVADNVPLAVNNHVWADGSAKMNNPYFAQFSADNMSGYPEVLLWRDYNIDMGIKHSAGYYIRVGGNSGFTRQYMETFLMKNGLPIYAAHSGYKGDESISDVRADRDERLQLFTMTPNEVLTEGQVEFVDTLPSLPNILAKAESRCVTGYQMRKGLSDNWSRDWNQSAEGCPIFRATEAYLNYLEASCIENGGSSIDAKAANYWHQLRERAGLPADYNVTVAATDLSKENDWAVYSAGMQVTPLLFNIRRERRCELLEEGFRMDDLKRWRSLDQLNATWQPEGFNLWESGVYKKYEEQGYKLVDDGSDLANVSSRTLSTYLRPYEIMNKTSNLMYGKGYNWCEAHYLNPISVVHFRNTATDPKDVNTSVIYQNPGWPIVADQGPTVK